jgi:hypothetical protein
MTGTAGYERAFLAFSTVLGEPREAIDAALGDEAAWGRVPGLQATSREARARAVAAIVAEVTAEIDETVLA